MISTLVFVRLETPHYGAPPLPATISRILFFPGAYIDHLPFSTPFLLLLLIDAVVFVLFVWFLAVLVRRVRQRQDKGVVR
jgi:hypothetical protein